MLGGADSEWLNRNRNMEFKKGSQWASLSVEFVEYLIKNDKKIRKIFKRSYCPDETLFQTMVWGSSFRKNLYNKDGEPLGYVRKIDWGRGRPYVGRTNDIEELSNCGMLFARKFSTSDLEVFKELKERISK